jgi:hypothetical protein
VKITRQGTRTSYIDQEHQRSPSLLAQFNKMRRFQCRGGEEDAVIRDDTDGVTVDTREALASISYLMHLHDGRRKTYRHQGGPVLLLKLPEPAPVHHPRDHIAHIERTPYIGPYDPAQVSRSV